MVVLLFLFLLSVAALTRTAAVPSDGQPAEDICERYVLPKCTREYDPVCGSNGRTYPSECMLCFDNMLYQLNTSVVKKGAC